MAAHCLYVQKSSISKDYTKNRNYQLVCWWGFSVGHILFIAFQTPPKLEAFWYLWHLISLSQQRNLYRDKGRIWINQAFRNYLFWASQSSQEIQKCIWKDNIFNKLNTIQTEKLTFWWIQNKTPILGNKLHIYSKRPPYRPFNIKLFSSPVTVLFLGINYYWYQICTDLHFKTNFIFCTSEGSGLLAVTL